MRLDVSGRPSYAPWSAPDPTDPRSSCTHDALIVRRDSVASRHQRQVRLCAPPVEAEPIADRQDGAIHAGGRRAPGPPRARSARGRHGPARTVAVHRAGGQWQDDDARRAGRLADRHRDAARGDPGDHLQQAGRRRDDRAARRRRRAARGGDRARSACARSTPWGARSCATRACRSSRSSTARPSWPRSRHGPTRPRACGSTRSSRGSRSSSGVAAADVAADPDAGPMARAFVAYEAAVAAIGGLDFDDLILRAIATARGRPGPAGPLARAVPRTPGRRGPGRRPRTAPSRPAAGGPGEPDLPRR